MRKFTQRKEKWKAWLFTPPLTIYKRTAIRRLPTARNSKTVSFFRRWQQCSSSFCIWSREPRCGGFGLTSGSKSKNSLKQENLLLPLCIFIRNPVLYRINTNPTVMGICLFGRRSRYMFLDSEPEGEIQLPRSGVPLKEKKKRLHCYQRRRKSTCSWVLRRR